MQDSAPAWRHSYGAFARYSPAQPWVISAEADVLINTFQGVANRTGLTGFVTTDYEPWKGLHFTATGEFADASFAGGSDVGAWGGLIWFFLPHVDIRGDYIYRSLGSNLASGSRTSTNALLAQLHFYL